MDYQTVCVARMTIYLVPGTNTKKTKPAFAGLVIFYAASAEH